MSTRGAWLGTAFFAALIGLFFYENGVLLMAELRFTIDCQRDMFLMYGLSHEGVLPHTGIRVAALGWDLGPLYHIFMAPFLSVLPSPLTVHWVNLIICAMGLFAYWRWARIEFGDAPALMGLFLYTQSTGHTAMVDTAWHVGATPGVIFGLIGATGSWLRTGKRTYLVLAGSLGVILIQLHSLGLVFGPAAVIALYLGRRHLTTSNVAALATGMLLVGLPLFLYLFPSLGDRTMGLARHRGAFQLTLENFWPTISAFLQPRYLLDPLTTRFFVLSLLLIGTIGVPLRRRIGLEIPATWHSLYVILATQIVVGSISTATVISYEFVGRYFMPIIIPLFVLATQGAAFLQRWLLHLKRTRQGVGVTFGVIALVLIASGPADTPVLSTLATGGATLDTEESLDYLLAEEQDAITSYFVKERGLRWHQLRGRIHGLFFGPNTGVQYFERIYRDFRGTAPRSEELQYHWRVRDEEDTAPALPVVVETIRKKLRTRTLVLERYRPNIDLSSLEINTRKCGWSLPYIWSQSTTDQLHLVGYPLGHGPDLHQCIGNQQSADIRFRVSPETVSVSLEISLDGAISPSDLLVTISTPSLPSIRLQPILMPSLSKARFVITLPEAEGSKEVRIVLPANRTVGFLDIY